MSPRIRGGLAVVAAGVLAASVSVAPAYASDSYQTGRAYHGSGNVSVKQLTRAVTVKAVLKHLAKLQQVSDRNGDRAAGRPGHRASVEYIVRELREAGYRPTVQEFDFDYYDENSQLVRNAPNPTTYVERTDFLRNSFDSGVPQGTATGALTPVDVVIPAADLPANSNTSGCEAEDFAGFTPGAVALMQRGTCGFAVKALNAQAAGASAVIIMNEGQEGRTGLTSMIGDATGLTIPAVFTTSAAGEDLYSTPGASVTVTVAYESDVRTAYNVLAETKTGRDSNTVMVGAHLDSVQDGAGINDNGTGSAALLETAIQMKKSKVNNTVRFAWWGAEEEGLLGSEHYVANLSQEEIDQIALYLNFDMIGSPNYFFGVYDGDNSSGTAPDGFIPEGSAAIEDVFERFYTNRHHPFQDTDFSGRSDYGPFIAVGVPAGGLFTGAEEVKTEEEVALYGGVAGAAYDPCYHEPCDNLRGDGQDVALYDQLREDYRLVGNVNKFALDVNSDALAVAVATFARDTSTVNGVTGPTKPQRLGASHMAGKDTDGPFKNRWER